MGTPDQSPLTVRSLRCASVSVNVWQICGWIAHARAIVSRHDYSKTLKQENVPDKVSELTLPARNSTSSTRSIRSYLQSLKAPVLLGLCCFLVYNANLRQIGAGDTLPARYLPLILWHSGTLELDANARLVAHGHSMIPDWNRNRTAGADGDINGNVSYFEPWAY